MEPSVCQASDSIIGVYIAVNRQMSTLELQVSVPERGLSDTSSCHWEVVDKPHLLSWDKMELLCVHLWPCLWRHGSRTGWTRPLDQEVQLVSVVQWRSWLVFCVPAASSFLQLPVDNNSPLYDLCPHVLSAPNVSPLLPSVLYPPHLLTFPNIRVLLDNPEMSGLGWGMHASIMFLILYCNKF